MTNADLDKVADEVLDVPDDQLDDYRGSPEPFYVKPRIVAAIRAAVLKAYEEAARVADQVAEEEDQFAEEQGLPPDHGGNPEYARRIRDLKTCAMKAGPSTETPSVCVVVVRCNCGWFDYYPSFSESPSTCPTCSRDLVIRNQTDIDEIIYPTASLN